MISKNLSTWGSALALAAGCLLANPVRAAAVYDLTLFTGNAGTLGAVDDASVAVNIGFNVSFFGVSTSQLYVNNNGNVSFTSPLASFIPPSDLRSATVASVPVPVIAPFFADVDTLGPGSGFAHYGNAFLDGHNVFAVTWSGVGYWDANIDKRNNFQLLIIDRNEISPGSFDFVFNYDTIQWEAGTGDASGLCNPNPAPGDPVCPPASVGWGNGAGAGRLLQGSGVNGALLDAGAFSLVNHSLNSLVAGRYYFAVRGGVVQTGLTPEPATWLLTGAALCAAAASRRWRAASAR
jgi:hypothetical protein